MESECTSKTVSSRRKFVTPALLRASTTSSSIGRLFWGTVREPIGEIEAWSCSCVESIHWDGITIEIIKHYGLNRWFGHATNFEAVGSKVVSEKLNRFAIDNKFFMSRHQCYKTHLAIGKLRAKCVSQPVTPYKEPQAFVALFGIVVVEIILVNGGGRFVLMAGSTRGRRCCLGRASGGGELSQVRTPTYGSPR